MANLHGFNARTVEPTSSFDPLPAGKYLVAIVESEMKPTKQGDGSFLELKFEVVEGEYQGRHAWGRLNLHNQNATAVKIAQGELSAICHAVGVMEPRDSVELHNIPLVITVKLKKREDNGELTNEIKGYAARASATAAAPSPQGSQDDPRPWLRPGGAK